MKFSITSAVVSAVLVVAGLADLGAAQTPTCLCSAAGAGSATYSGSQITSALSAARTTVSGYPHRFNNRESIAFPRCSGQLLTEFPILPTATFGPGKRAGVDRVIYNSARQFCGCITHRGEVNNAFRGCSFN